MILLKGSLLQVKVPQIPALVRAAAQLQGASVAPGDEVHGAKLLF